jgi:hypothetical protein
MPGEVRPMAIRVHLSDRAGGCVMTTRYEDGFEVFQYIVLEGGLCPSSCARSVRQADGTWAREGTLYELSAEQVRSVLEGSPRFKVVG